MAKTTAEGRLKELLEAKPEIDVVRGRVGDLLVYTDESRLSICLGAESPDQQNFDVHIIVYPPHEEGPTIRGRVRVRPVGKGVEITSQQEAEERIDVSQVVTNAARGAELFEAAKSVGFNNVPYRRVNNYLQQGDDDPTRFALMTRAADAVERGKSPPRRRAGELPSEASVYMAEILGRAAKAQR